MLRVLGYSEALMRLNESPSEKEGKFQLQTKPCRRPQSLNESPSEKEGKSILRGRGRSRCSGLNESPSEKEGKFSSIPYQDDVLDQASMKALPKRKGNVSLCCGGVRYAMRLNESPSEKEGKWFGGLHGSLSDRWGLNESPSEKEGKY